MKFIVFLIFFLFLIESSYTYSLLAKPKGKQQANKKKQTNTKEKSKASNRKKLTYPNSNGYKNNRNSAKSKSKQIENILDLEDAIKNENISPIDGNVINDEIFLISKGKVENIDKLTSDELRKMPKSDLDRIEDYLSGIPKINSEIGKHPELKSKYGKANDDIESSNYDENNDGNSKSNKYNKRNSYGNGNENENENYYGENYSGNEDVPEFGLKLDNNNNSQKGGKETLFSYLANVNKKIKESKNNKGSNKQKNNKSNNNNYNKNNRRNSGPTNNHPKDRFRGSFIKESTDDLRRAANEKNKKDMRRSLIDVLNGKSFSSFQKPNVQKQLNQIIKKVNEKGKQQNNDFDKMSKGYGKKFRNIKNYDDYEFEYNSDIDDDELDEVLTYGKEGAEKNRRNRRRNRRRKGNSDRKNNKKNNNDKRNNNKRSNDKRDNDNNNKNKNNDEIEEDNNNLKNRSSKSINYNYVNLKNKNLRGKLKSLSEFLLNSFNELLYNKILSIEFYVTKYKLKESQASFLRTAVDKFYYPMLSEKIIVSLLDDTKKIHFLGEEYLKKNLVKPLPRKIYKTLHDFLTMLSEALIKKGVDELKDDILVNFAKLVY